MDQESDVIRHQMENTRASLTDKLEVLEHHVSDTVTNAAETVERVRHTVQDAVTGATDTVSNMQHAIQETVESVRDSVRETAESVGETLDLRKQVEKHPWGMVAGATAFGFGIAVLTSRLDSAPSASFASMRAKSRQFDGEENADKSPSFATYDRSPSSSQNGRYPSSDPGQNPWLPVVDQFKGVAIGAMFGVLRDVLSKSVPEAIKGQVDEVIDSVTTSLGGKPIGGRMLPEAWGEKPLPR